MVSPPRRAVRGGSLTMAELSDTDLPRLGGITEPMTVATNVLIAAVAFVLTVRLGYYASAEGLKAAGAMAGALMGTAFASVLGAISHGIDPLVDRALRRRMWRAAVHAMTLIGVGSIMCVAFFAARGQVRTAILVVGAVYAVIRWSEPGAPWLIAAILVTFVASVMQARRVGFHRHFNHNDLFHVIQLVALYLFYRGGLLLVDR